MKLIKNYLSLFLLLTAVVIVFTSFNSTRISEPKYNNNAYKPVNDFAWIMPYTCIYDIFNQDQWEKNPTRSFDSLGVHLTNKNYHPVNACHYALYCYDEYNATGNERFKRAFLAQVNYLRDSTKYKEFDGNKVGYPYHIIFHDLKPPWYSALAQSEAISVLIRYYALTKDESIIPLIVKLKNFMVAPMEADKGTMTRTPEGHLWYEEYPNSKQDKLVLNGFFLSIVALHDYVNLFPDDFETKCLYDSCLISAKASIKFYDTGTWLKYNRGDGHLVANGYMKWQILEMKFLYNITSDIFFKNQYMLWSTYAFNKPYETVGCKLTDYNFSTPVSLNSGKFVIKQIEKLFKYNININEFGGNIGDTNQLKKLFDNNRSTLCSIKNTVEKSEANRAIYFKLNKPVSIDCLKLKFRSVDTTVFNGLVVYYLQSDKKGWRQIKKENISGVQKSIVIAVNQSEVRGIKIMFAGLREVMEWQFEDIECYEQAKVQASDFIHYQTGIIKSDSSILKFDVSLSSTKDFIVYYKEAKDSISCLKQTWTQEKFFKTTSTTINSPGNKYFCFLIIAKREGEDVGIKSVTIKN